MVATWLCYVLSVICSETTLVTFLNNGVYSAAEGIQKLAGKEHPVNIMRDGFEGSAEFLGFDRKVGLLAYQLMDLSTSYYGMFKLTLKPDA